MPTPREQALKNGTQVEPITEGEYNAEAGHPNGQGMPNEGRPDTYAVNVTNPPTPPAPVKNLK